MRSSRGYLICVSSVHQETCKVITIFLPYYRVFILQAASNVLQPRVFASYLRIAERSSRIWYEDGAV
jgi:hypothetical protein